MIVQSRPVRMNIATWKSLSEADQRNWDSVTEDGKSKILDYTVQRAARSRPGNPLTDNAVLELMNPMPRSM
jgi:hypothetical protein